jgi:ATP-binding cassette subfamily B protein
MNTSSLWRALRFFSPDWPRVLAALGLVSLATGAGLFKPWPLALLVDCVLGTHPWPKALNQLAEVPKLVQVMALSALTLALHLGHGALQSVLNFTLIDTGLRGLMRVRQAVFEWLMRLSLRRLYRSQAGDILYRVTWDTYAFQTLFQHGVFSFLTASAAVLAMGWVMARLNGSLTLVAMATVPVLLSVMTAFGRQMARRAELAQAQDSQLSSSVQQGLANLQLTQSYTREPQEKASFLAQSSQSWSLRRRQHALEVLYLATVSVVFALGTAAILLVGSRQVLAGQLSLGELLIFLAYLSQLYEPLNQLSHVGSTLSNARAGTRRIFELFDDQTDLPGGAIQLPSSDSSPAAAGISTAGPLVFDRIHFGYELGHEVLKSVSMEIRVGQCIAIIGPSGAGKSTLLQMIPRFFDPLSGAVRWEGVDLRELDLRSWRAHVALVLQEPLLIRGTLFENIAYGRLGATSSEVEAAAQLANADGFIRRLPKGYKSVVGDGAVRLSVGEKQRINLARAFLKNAPILLLDEPTSALDAASEAHVLESLRRTQGRRITLMVTHRPETLRFVDKVLVLEDGRVVDCCSPEAVRWQTTFTTKLSADGGS